METVMSAFHALESRVTLVKGDGQRLPVRAVVNPEMMIFDRHVPVQLGDHVERTLPSRMVEQYRIADLAYYDTTRHYECRVERVDAASTEKAHAHARDIVVSRSQNVVVQVGNNLHVAQPAAASPDRSKQLQADLSELNEHVLALLDQDIATKKILWDLSEASDSARDQLQTLLERIQLIASTGKATDETVRATLELVLQQVQASGGLNKQLMKWVATHPITQNIVASILFELMKSAF